MLGVNQTSAMFRNLSSYLHSLTHMKNYTMLHVGTDTVKKCYSSLNIAGIPEEDQEMFLKEFGNRWRAIIVERLAERVQS